MMDADFHRDIGRLEGRITALESRVAEGDRRNEAAFSSLQAGLDGIRRQLNDAALTDASRIGNVRGAWWVMGALLSVASVIGGFVSGLFK